MSDTDENMRFIDYLDRYKSRDTLNPSEYDFIKSNIDNDFLLSQYNNVFYNNSYTNPLYTGCYINPEPIPFTPSKYTNASSEQLKEEFERLQEESKEISKKIEENMETNRKKWNSAFKSYNTPLISNLKTGILKTPSYTSNIICPSILPFVDAPVIEVKKIHKVHITTSVSSFIDLINIIDNNEYRADTEYNINLKSLHLIRNELVEMDNMIGMKNLKSSILDQLLYFLQNLHEGANSDFKHTVIYGEPGTGKTEISKLIGQMYSKVGILKNNIFKKVSRSDLIAGYLGQTAIKTKGVVEQCLGGCLFIDEVYSLGSGDASSDIFSKECIDTLCECLSEHRDNLMVIIAGYETEINNSFFNVNRGLESRFIWRFNTDKYDYKELTQIFTKKTKMNEWSISCNNDVIEKWFFNKENIFKFFGRDMEMLLSYSKICHGRRIYGLSSDLRKKITLEDLNQGYALFKHNTAKSDDISTIHHGLYV